MKRTYIGSLGEHKGEEVIIKGWIDVRRDQGKLIFLDFRDMSGKIQGVILPGSEAMETGQEIRPEWVVEVKGKVNERPERNVQADKQNGDIELEILQITVLNKSETLPIDISTDGKEIGEDVRLKYRYVDLKRERLQGNLRKRSAIVKLIRDMMEAEGFTDVDTPILTKSTPEGARDYVVPSRLDRGSFYALPQSPQTASYGNWNRKVLSDRTMLPR